MNVGTRVVAITNDEYNGREGVVVGDPGYSGWLRVKIAGSDAPHLTFAVHELSPVPFVKVVKTPTIWVTLPGDTVSRKLSVEDANRLLRQLEVALS